MERAACGGCLLAESQEWNSRGGSFSVWPHYSNTVGGTLGRHPTAMWDYPETQILIGGDFNVTLRADD